MEHRAEPNVADDIRPGEVSCALPQSFDAGLYFIGSIHTPWRTRGECPRRGDQDGPVCRIEIDPRWRDAASKLFLQEAARQVILRGGTIINVDATVIAQEPRLMPYAAAMKVNIAEALGIECGVFECTHQTGSWPNPRG